MKPKMIEKNHVRLYGFDGTFVDIPHTKAYTNEMWRRGKCWSVFCRNELHFVKLNKRGEAVYGYCFHAEKMILNAKQFSPYFTRGGQKWVYVERGKIKTLIKKEGNR